MTHSPLASTVVRLVSKWTILPGCEAEARAALVELAVAVQANEPNTLMYLVHTPFDDGVLASLPPVSSREVLFFEAYASPQAFQDHVDGPIFTSFLARFGKLFLAAPGQPSPYVSCEFLQPLAGYVRAMD